MIFGMRHSGIYDSDQLRHDLLAKMSRITGTTDRPFGIADRIDPGWDCSYCGGLQPLDRYSCRCCGAPRRRES